MTQLTLNRLTLRNFKGVKECTIQPNGESISIYGANGTGKTTIGDAISYILFHKDMKDRSPQSFGIKRTENGEPIEGIEAVVEAEFNLFTLKKVCKQKWTGRNGDRTYTGDTYDYFVDGFEKQAKEYEQFIREQLGSIDQLKMLSVVDYFISHMNWSDRRPILMQLASDIQDSDIVLMDKELHGYIGIAKGHEPEQVKSKLTKELNEVRKKLETEIQARIDEASMQLEQVEGAQEAKERIEALTAEQDKIRERISDLQSGAGLSEIRAKMQQLDVDMREVVNKAHSEQDESLSQLRQAIAQQENELDKANGELRKANRDFQEHQGQIVRRKEAISIKEQAISDLRDQQPDDQEQGTTCPLCGNLRKGVSDAEYKEYLANFNSNKAERLKEMEAEVVLLSQELESAQISFEVLRKEAKQAQQEAIEAEQRLKDTRQILDDKKSGMEDPTQSEAYTKLIEQKNKLRKALEAQHETTQGQVATEREKINAISEQVTEHQRVLEKVEKNAKIQARIAELNAERARLADQLEELEADIHTVELFIRKKAEYLSDYVNEKFTRVEWRLFEQLKNGSIKEICEPTINGVGVNEGLNTAEVVAAGLEVIDVLSKHFGTQVPVVIDNRESVTRIPDTNLQVISLLVSPQDQAIRVDAATELQSISA